jgi:hypothetical protein
VPEDKQLPTIMKQNKFAIKPSKINPLLLPAITILIAIAILGYLIYRERQLLLAYNWQFHPQYFALTFILYSIDLAIVALVWGWIMNTLSKQLNYLTHFRYFSIANITKRIPGTLWYIANRAQLYKSNGIDPKLTTVASGMELAVSVLSSVVVCGIFSIPIILQYELNPIILGVIVLLCIIVIHPRFMDWIFRLLKVEASEFSYLEILKWLITYIFAWILGGLLLFSLGNSITTIPIENLPYIIGSFGLVNLLSLAFFFLPTNLGITEVGLSLLLANIMPSSVAVVVAIAFRLVVILYEIVWALISIASKHENTTI